MSKRTTTRSLTVLAIAFSALLPIIGCSSHSTAPPGHGEGAGQENVVVCHKGKRTLTVAGPAAQAHLDHGDTLGPCG